MSVNIDLAFAVTGLADRRQAEDVVRAVQELLYDESLENQVSHGWSVDDAGAFFVSGESDHPLGITRFYLWQPHFEGLFAATVAGVAPAAAHEIRWGYPDEEY
ncbi:hypothetical protein C0216_27025 [Streptomyces globosus]|uniref:Uncharacterized protein n=1 Tax=Streptomyces globosus TaxID=68209 RepID=A0A344U6T4_9ACTN|nr:hypothetical protein [Streptomyces globosus]AXE26605.1 hypothetical protein C0216_27025 [Streptomyces globosus]